jgi:hypothetical protein
MRKTQGPIPPTEPAQLRLVSSVSPLCIVCGKAVARTLWAVVRVGDDRELLVHALGCFDAWRAGDETRRQGAAHPTTDAP